MRNHCIVLIFLLLGLSSYSQFHKTSYIGNNVLQLPSSTINANYSVEPLPFLTPMVDAGYALGTYNVDIIGYFLTAHSKCYDGYDLEMPTGGYVKLGGYLNLRRDFNKSRFFHLGVFLNNAMVHEKGTYSPASMEEAYAVSHTVYLSGISTAVGYEFNLGRRLKSSIDYQISFPSDKYKDLYSYETFIPGMGYQGSGERWHPMLMMNIKYRL